MGLIFVDSYMLTLLLLYTSKTFVDKEAEHFS
jgi:hypothetical protein